MNPDPRYPGKDRSPSGRSWNFGNVVNTDVFVSLFLPPNSCFSSATGADVSIFMRFIPLSVGCPCSNSSRHACVRFWAVTGGKQARGTGDGAGVAVADEAVRTYQVILRPFLRNNKKMVDVHTSESSPKEIDVGTVRRGDVGHPHRLVKGRKHRGSSARRARAACAAGAVLVSGRGTGRGARRWTHDVHHVAVWREVGPPDAASSLVHRPVG